MAKYEIKNGVGIIPEGTKEIEVDAFAGCTELISVTIPETVTSIGDGAFWCCDNLTEIVIPASVNQIGHSLFGGCEKLKSVVVKEGNNTYDSREQCNAIIETGSGRLVAGCMTSVIPQSVKEIGFAAFRNCTTLQEIHIPDGVTAISEYAFISCQALTSIVLPEGITEIKECTFQECTNRSTCCNQSYKNRSAGISNGDTPLCILCDRHHEHRHTCICHGDWRQGFQGLQTFRDNPSAGGNGGILQGNAA